jgi:hypothetical protein
MMTDEPKESTKPIVPETPKQNQDQNQAANQNVQTNPVPADQLPQLHPQYITDAEIPVTLRKPIAPDKSDLKK